MVAIFHQVAESRRKLDAQAAPVEPAPWVSTVSGRSVPVSGTSRNMHFAKFGFGFRFGFGFGLG